MLTELRIAKFAIIDQLSLECAHGLHVLTGETGAGKSIIVDALTLLVGGRADEGFIRAGEEEAVLEAAFTVPADNPLGFRLREAGLLGEGETEVIVRRVLSRTGRHKLYLNGSLTPLKTLQSLAGTLIDIHGQHEQQSLLSAHSQLYALDAFAHAQDIRQPYTQAYHEWRAQQQDCELLRARLAERAQREELLRFQHRELQEANLKPGEEEALQADRNRLAHSQRLSELSQGAYGALYGDDASLLGSLGQVRGQLRELASIDPSAGEWMALCDGAVTHLKELAQHLRAYHEGLEQDPARLVQMEERLDRLLKLKRKYGGTEAALLAKRDEVQREIDLLESGDTQLVEMERRAAETKTQAEKLADRLSRERAKAGKALESRVMEELAGLRMDRTRFQILVETDRTEAGFGPSGRDRVEYRFSANEGEPPQPLARVASGGELSRVMLAMKTVLVDTDGVPTLIFDEVDAGVGGAVAAVMGKRLHALAKYHQVFCITHLPQIASQADVHYVVEKVSEKKRTVTRVRCLDAAGRKEEVARMLGGLAVTKAVRETAAEMISEARKTH